MIKILLLMKSNIFLKSTVLNSQLCLLALALVTLSSFGCNQKDDKSNKLASSSSSLPNVILIMTDDQGYGDLGYHGNSIIKTPHLDAFAQTAVELTNFHVGTTCSPTRAGILTGRNSNRNGAWHTIAGCSILNQGEETIAEVYSKNGYKTGMFGKWHLGDNYPYRPHDRGFDEALYCGGGGVWQTPDYWTNNYFDDTYFRNGKPEKTEGYCTDVWFDETIKFIEANRENPFFVYLTPNAAHGPFNVPPEYLKLFDDAALTPMLKRFYGMVTNLDDNFGKLISFLETNQLANNTIVIYTTDNGTAGGIRSDPETGKEYGYNAGMRGRKGSQYDGGHRVPFLLRFPEGSLPGGVSNAELIAHVDLLPTLASLCGLQYTPSKPLDGMDRLEYLRGKQDDTTRMLVIDTQRNQWPEKGRNPCVMSRDWRLVNGNELYNMLEDPGQQVNVADRHPQRVEQMQKFYDQWWSSTEADWHYSEIPIGHEEANPCLITVHDLHNDEGINWNQQQIRLAANNPSDGYYSVEIISGGTYEFQLSRYPPESDLALNASAPLIEGSDYMNELSAGKALNITGGLVEFEGVSYSADVQPDQKSIRINGKFPAKKGKLKTWFILADGQKIPAYYSLVKKV